MKTFKPMILMLSLMPILFLFQNCSSPNSFVTASSSESSSTGGLGDADSLDPAPSVVVEEPDSPNNGPDLIVFGDDNEPIVPGNGLKGKVYYLLNDSGAEEIPETMKDKAGNAVAFPDGITGVDFMIQNGYVLPAEILLAQLFIPTFSFQLGFKQSNGTEITDILGNRLVEAFAMDLRGTLQLGAGMDAGIYEFGVLSDDGAILDADMDGDGVFETSLVNNDGNHATKLGCGALGLVIDGDTKISIRLRYYQGPRTRVALSVLMRKIDAVEDAGQDVRCDVESSDEWFATVNDAPADLVNSLYGEIVSRGWFPAGASAFQN